MSFKDKPLRDRPFKRAMFARRLRKAALHKYDFGKQLTEKEHEQFVVKTKDLSSLSLICDEVEKGDIDWVEWWTWFMDNWSSIRKFVETIAPGHVGATEAHNKGPKRRGSRHVPPRYQDDVDFLADKEEWLRELSGEPESEPEPELPSHWSDSFENPSS